MLVFWEAGNDLTIKCGKLRSILQLMRFWTPNFFWASLEMRPFLHSFIVRGMRAASLRHSFKLEVPNRFYHLVN